MNQKVSSQDQIRFERTQKEGEEVNSVDETIRLGESVCIDVETGCLAI